MKWNSIVLASLIVAFVATLAGCGKSDDAQGDNGGTNKEQADDKIKAELVGKWQGGADVDDQVVRKALTDAEGDLNRVKQIESSVESLRSTAMEIEFLADGTMISSISSGDEIESNGFWEVVEDRGKSVIIKTTEYGDEMQDEEREIELHLEGKDTFSIELNSEIPKIGVMRFKRLR